MTVPSVNWHVAFPTGSFKSSDQKNKPDSTSAYFVFSDTRQNSIMPMVASFFIEPSKDCADAKCLRDVAWKKLQPTLKDIQDVQQSEIGDAAVVEYTDVANYLQKNMYAHFYKNGYWVDLHLSQGFSDPANRVQFVDFVKSVTFVPKNSQ